MANLTADRIAYERGGHETRSFSALMKAAAVCFEGGMVFGTAGYAHGGTPLAGDVYLGQAEVSVDNTSGSNGAQIIQLRRGVAKWDNAGTNAITQANLGQRAYASSDHEVASTGVVPVGFIDEIDSDGGIWVFDGGDAAPGAGAGYSDTVLTASPGITLPQAEGPIATYDVETTATVVGVLPNGLYAGQQIEIYQSVAASTPVGTVTGAFANNLNAAKTTLALGTAVGLIFKGVWTGTAWRQRDALGGTASSLS